MLYITACSSWLLLRQMLSRGPVQWGSVVTLSHAASLQFRRSIIHADEIYSELPGD
jgi:hypothetical protein